MLSLTVQVALGILSLLAFNHLLSLRRRRRYPPGPPGLPIVGNLFDLEKDLWLPFTRWKHEYGPLAYISVFGRSILVLNTHKAAGDLLESRGALYSDRPQIVVGTIATGGDLIAFLGHTDKFRRFRRATHDVVSKSAVPTYFPIQTREALLWARCAIDEPALWKEHMYRSTTSASSSILYDIAPLESHEDPRISHVIDFMDRIAYMTATGNFFAEFLPWMRHLPRWIAPWKRYAENCYSNDSAAFGKMYDDVKNGMDSGDDSSCITANLIKSSDLTKNEAAWLSAGLFVASEDTSSASIEWFIKSMMLYPHVQKKAQAELDLVVGRHRTPNFSDLDDLPYIHAIVREVLRLWPVSPLGFPHRILTDDVYEGYSIPGGTIVFGNIWALNRDRDIYGPDADEFNPDRHLDEKGRIAPVAEDIPFGHVTFGFGRRICAGRYMAVNSLFINAAMMLWAANIVPANNADEQPSKDGYIYNGLIMKPSPFTCSISPRFSAVRDILIQASEYNG